jgi:hypothetical protein
MADDSIAPSLELEQDLNALRREWRFERAGWFILGVLMVAAMAGLFGDGPLAHVTRGASSDPATTVSYERVVRVGTEHLLSVTLAGAAPTDTLPLVYVERDYLRAMAIARITPEPAETRVSQRWIIFSFRRPMAAQPIRVDFALSPTGVGSIAAMLSTAQGDIQLHQFVLP